MGKNLCLQDMDQIFCWIGFGLQNARMQIRNTVFIIHIYNQVSFFHIACVET